MIKYFMPRIINVNFGNDSDNLTIQWQLHENILARRWFHILESAIPFGIREHDRLYGLPGQFWDKTEICNQLTKCMKHIETFYPNFFSFWPHVEMTQDDTNIMHVKFEQLRGSVDTPSELFLQAPEDIKQQISLYNVLIHRWESYCQGNYPRLVCTFMQGFSEILQEQDFENFSMHHEWGTMFINYPLVGKQMLDCFRDQDDYIVSGEAIRPMNRISSAFGVYFYELSQVQATVHQNEFYKYFKRRENYFNSLGLFLGDKRLALGIIPVGDIIETQPRRQLLQELGRLNRINRVWVN